MSEEQVEETVEETTERDWLAEATVLGYHDPEASDYKGDPEKALTPEEFVKRGEEILPIVNANNKKLQAEIKKQNEDFQKEKVEFRKHMDSTLKRERAEHERKLEEAVSDGDVERYKKLKENEPVKQEETKISEIESEFTSRNDWYGSDDKKTKLAENIDREMAPLRGVLTSKEYVDQLEARIENLMPTKTPHNTVTSGRKRPASSKAKTYESMPSDIKATCTRMVKEWGIDKDEYVKNYYAGEE